MATNKIDDCRLAKIAITIGVAVSNAMANAAVANSKRVTTHENDVVSLAKVSCLTKPIIRAEKIESPSATDFGSSSSSITKTKVDDGRETCEDLVKPMTNVGPLEKAELENVNDIAMIKNDRAEPKQIPNEPERVAIANERARPKIDERPSGAQPGASLATVLTG